MHSGHQHVAKALPRPVPEVATTQLCPGLVSQQLLYNLLMHCSDYSNWTDAYCVRPAEVVPHTVLASQLLAQWQAEAAALGLHIRPQQQPPQMQPQQHPSMQVHLLRLCW